ncbi:TPA: hypothetical protein ACTYQH_003718 [Klebsiella michiganensis]|uniref:hypothetical protein n=1 Tax=Klebsiella michiganensis TaxID=1134687 RepID=UPI0025511D49|nr:hypothetical protein [Klebsiella michiganensis]MDK9842069.1 hypothetical protein [Klebsiella michiganensis]
MNHHPAPPIKNAETEAYCKEMSKEYGKLLKKHVEGSTEFIRARMKLSESIMEWMASRNLVLWEQIAIADRIKYLAMHTA